MRLFFRDSGLAGWPLLGFLGMALIQELTATLMLLPILGIASGAERSAPVAPFDVVQQGRPACSIVIAAHPTLAARLAALELQFHILKLSGAEIPIRSENERKGTGNRSRSQREVSWRNAGGTSPS